MMQDQTITDKYGDTLALSSYDDTIFLDAIEKDSSTAGAADLAFTREQATQLRDAVNAFLGEQDQIVDRNGTPLSKGDKVQHDYSAATYGDEVEVLGFNPDYSWGAAVLVRSNGSHVSDGVHFLASRVEKVDEKIDERPTEENTAGVIDGEERIYDIRDANYGLLVVAIEFGLEASITYAKGTEGRNLEARRFKPEGFVTSQSGNVSVYGEDQDRDDTRMFRLDRIKGRVIVR